MYFKTSKLSSFKRLDKKSPVSQALKGERKGGIRAHEAVRGVRSLRAPRALVRSYFPFPVQCLPSRLERKTSIKAHK